MITIVQLALIITVIIASFLSVFIYSNQRLSYSRLVLIIHFVSIALWGICILIVLQQSAAWAVTGSFLAGIGLVVSKFYFVLSWPENQKPSGRNLYLPLTVAGFITVVTLWPNTVWTDFTSVAGSYVLISNGALAGLYTIILTFFIIHPILNLQYKIKRSDYPPQTLEQLKLLLSGISFFFLLALITNLILPVYFKIHYLNGIGPSLSLILAGYIFYIITRYNFLDLKLIIQRGFIYTILFGFVTSVYFVVLFALNLLSHYTTLNPVFSGLITTIIGVFSTPHLDRWLRRITDKLCFKKRYSYSETIHKLSRVISRSVSLTDLRTRLTDILTSTLKTSSVLLAPVSPDHKHIHQMTIKTELVPEENNMTVFLLRNNDRVVGTLILGPKLSGENYSKIDFKLLKTITHQLAVALERATLYEELKQYSKQLEEKVTKRTEELQLSYQSQQAMLSNIAHNLQTPLTVIENEIDSLDHSHLDSQLLSPLRRSLQSISNFIYDILQLAQLESPTYTLDRQHCNLSAFMEDVAAYVETILSPHNINVVSNIEPGISAVVDKRKIEEVLLVLISNASKYMGDSNERIVTLSLSTQGDQVILSVADTGIGIPAAAQSKIFDRFFRAHGDELNITGSGIGLTTAKAIIDKHHGTITVTSTPAVGSIFTITLPTN